MNALNNCRKNIISYHHRHGDCYYASSGKRHSTRPSGPPHPPRWRWRRNLQRSRPRMPFSKPISPARTRSSPGFRKRLFGSSSEKLDPAQLQLLFDELVLGKPALLRTKAAKHPHRRRKNQTFQEAAAPRLIASPRTSRSSLNKSSFPTKSAPAPTNGPRSARNTMMNSMSSNPRCSGGAPFAKIRPQDRQSPPARHPTRAASLHPGNPLRPCIGSPDHY
jgi:hypothetical protein